MLEKVFKKIEAQQKGIEGTPAYFVGSHLKDILKRCPASCHELVLADLDVKEMSISCCEKKIKEYADKHKKGNLGFVPPDVAEGIICKFYGIEIDTAAVQEPIQSVKEEDSYIDLSDFI